MNYGDTLIKHLYEDEQFGKNFCEGCIGNRYDCGDQHSPPEYYCHFDYDMSDERCVRHQEWAHIECLCLEIAEIASENAND